MNLKVGRIIEMSTVRGEPIEVGNRRIVPIARALAVALSRPQGRAWAGFLWVRPLAIEVSEGESVRRVRILNLSRWLVFGLLALPGVLAVLIRLLGGAPRRSSGIKGIRR